MPVHPSRPFRWRRLLAAALLLSGAGLSITGHLLHWDDQLRLYWHEQQTSEEARQGGIWLPDYRLTLETTLEGLAKDETSGLTWSRQTGTLFTITGNNPQLVELNQRGEILRRIHLSGLSNPEAVEVLDGDRIAVVDERRHLLAIFRLGPDTQSLDLSQAITCDLGFADAGNKGFEGLAWDPKSRRLLVAKERDPLGLFSLALSEEGNISASLQPLPERHLMVRDLSSLTVDPRTGHTLLLSDESRLLIELDEQGEPLSFMSLMGGLNGLTGSIEQPEGVTMDDAGNIYVVGEPNRFYVFSREPNASAR